MASCRGLLASVRTVVRASQPPNAFLRATRSSGVAALRVNQQSRTIFGFGSAPELPAQQEVPWYKRKPDDDYLEHDGGITAEERAERVAMTDEILACHESGAVPDLDLYKRLITMLIKWNDREGVMNARDLAAELEVEFDEALTTKVEAYLEQADKEVWRQ
eukprot:TRINITY_DN7474_c0_g1_i2.p1 TRINITY_DN7474_c0_g1~~TRINITY_DN7474_c0_g1_i2.p1  ORF type:complete len:170 (+),score=22.89 TRINITY_DN7474_c0_g1_i2:29-511(+)